MTTINQEALFDPGFSPVLNHFLPVYQEVMGQISSLGNLNQKKFRYQISFRNIQKSLNSTFGFWVGCILWGVYLKNKFKDNPKKIIGNTLLGLSDEELKEYMFEEEFNFIENFLNNFGKETKYFLGREEKLDKRFFEIFNKYREFSTLNKNFTKTDMTSDLILPDEFNLEYSKSELDDIYSLIMSSINNKDLSMLLKYWENK